MAKRVSAGLIMYRIKEGKQEFFLALCDRSLRVDAITKVSPGAIFPFFERRQKDAGNAARIATCGDRPDPG